MEFSALPSQGAGSGNIQDPSRKDPEPGFEDALKNALNEGAWILGLPPFANPDSPPSIRPAPTLRDDPSRTFAKAREAETLSKSRRLGGSEEPDWRPLKREDRESPEEAGEPRPSKAATRASDSRDSRSGTGFVLGDPLQEAFPASADAISPASSSRTPSAPGRSGPSAASPSSRLPQSILRITTLMRERGLRTHRATLRLHPEKLGSLEIDLKLEKGRLSVRITAANAQTRRILEAEMDRIRSALQGQGFQELSLQLGAGREDGGRGGADGDPLGDLDTAIDIDTKADERVSNWDGLVDLLV